MKVKRRQEILLLKRKSFLSSFFILLFFPYRKKLELKGKEKEIKNLLFIIIILK